MHWVLFLGYYTSVQRILFTLHIMNIEYYNVKFDSK